MPELKGKSPEEVSPGKAKIVIFGASGVGKTWFALSFPKPYYFDAEGGANRQHYKERLKQAGGAYLGPSDGTRDFAFLFDQILALATKKHEYQTLVVDSITDLFQTAVAEEAARLGSKDAFGASKKPAVAAMRRLCALIARLDMNVVLIAHETSEWGPGATGREEIGKTADIWDKLTYILDLSLRAQKRGPSRVAIVVKSRLLGFPDQTTFPLEYSEFAPRYGVDFIEAESTPIVLATAEQVAEMDRIIKVIKLPEEDLQKVLDKYNAGSIAELTTDGAERTITWLKKKIS